MYKKIDISERQLEDLVRQHPSLIEEGMVHLTHQTQTPGGRLDVLLVDSGKSLVVAELKVVEDGTVIEGTRRWERICARLSPAR